RQLGELDYRYLSASQDLTQQVERQRLEAERTQALEAQWHETQQRRQQEIKAAKRQRVLLGFISGAFSVAVGLGLSAVGAYRQLNKKQIQLLATSAEALFSADHQLEALIDIVEAKRQLDRGGLPQ
ncbi:MAG: hypothetical protein AAF203_07690, partial [Pseudomonadota bacterium]